MYKPIWGLMFKCNGSEIQFKSIQFSQEYSNQRNMRKKSKDKIRTQDVTEFVFNNAYVSGTLNLQQLRLNQYIKKNFTLVELSPLHKNGLPSLSVTRVTTHLKTWVTTLKIRSEHYSLKRSWAQQLKRMFSRRSRMIKLGE
jgi:hypothetical protein